MKKRSAITRSQSDTSAEALRQRLQAQYEGYDV